MYNLKSEYDFIFQSVCDKNIMKHQYKQIFIFNYYINYITSLYNKFI